MHQKFTPPTIFFLLVLGVYFSFSVYHLTKFLTADEHYWIYERIPQYWNAWEKGKFKKTFINDKPGVSLALVTGPALLFFPHPQDHCLENPDRTVTCSSQKTEHLLLAFRLPLVIFNGLLLLFLFWILGKLTNPWIALWSATFIGLSPPLLGITQIINPDALLWSTSAAGLFSFYSLLKFSEKKFLYFTIFFTTLALLTKYVALILIPFYLFLVLTHFLARPDLHDRILLLQTFRRDFLFFSLTLLGTIVFSLVLLPAFLTDQSLLGQYFVAVPKKIWLFSAGTLLFLIVSLDIFFFQARLLFSIRSFVLKYFFFLRGFAIFLFFIFLATLFSRIFFPDWHFFSLPYDIKDLSNARYYGPLPNFFQSFFLEWHPLVFSLTPLSLLGLFFLWSEDARKTWPEFFYFTLSLPFFFILYLILLVSSNVLATPRYEIILFPLFALLSGIGFWYSPFGQKSVRTQSLLSFVLLGGSIVSLFLIFPFPFSYANSLLPERFLTQDSWGYGGYEAAQYMNQKPGAKDIVVWSDYYGFCEFFIGKCLTAYTFDNALVHPDYYVLTRRGAIRYLSRYERWERLSGLTAYKYYDRNDPLWSLEIDGRPENFVKIFQVEK